MSRGFTLLEVLVALTILAVAVVALMQLSSQGLRLLHLSDDYQQAVIVADRVARAAEVVEEARGRRTGGALPVGAPRGLVPVPEELTPGAGPPVAALRALGRGALGPRPQPGAGEPARGRGEPESMRRVPAPCERGFTLVEVVLALSIAAAVLVIVFGGLRVARPRGARARPARPGSITRAACSSCSSARWTAPSPTASSPTDGGSRASSSRAGRTRLTFATLAPPFPARRDRLHRGQSLQ